MSELMVADHKRIGPGKMSLWVDSGWDSVEFTRFLKSLDKKTRAGKVIYDQRNQLIHISADRQKGIKRDIVIKKFNLKRGYDILRFRFIRSKAVRSLKIALALEKIGVPTPHPVGLIETRDKFRKILNSNFITEYCRYDYSLMDLVKAFPEKPENKDKIKDIIPILAQDIRKMHDAGIIHNDLHDGNILIKDGEQPTLYYIDLNRARIKKKLSLKQRIKDLARFNWEKDLQSLFMENYLPSKSQELISLLLKEREKRVRVINLKKKIRASLGKRGKGRPSEASVGAAERR